MTRTETRARRRHRARAVQGRAIGSSSSPTTATSCSPGDERDRHARRRRRDPARLLQGPGEDRGDVPHGRAAGATRSPATTRPSTPTARSGCSDAARRASTPAARRCTPKRSSSRSRSHPDVFDCVVVGVPDDRWGEMVVALVAAGRRRDARRRRARRALPGDARRVQGAEAVRRASTRCSVRPRARPTTSCCASSRPNDCTWRSRAHEHVARATRCRRSTCGRRGERPGRSTRAARRARGRRVGGRARAERAVGAARPARRRAFPAPDEPPHRVRVPFRRAQRAGRRRCSFSWGFDAVNMAGGMQAWAAQGLPVVRDDGSPGDVI